MDGPDGAAGTGLRERKKARLRRRIAEATLEIVRERGYEGTTVEEIVRRVEISQPTFYKYYASKQAVLAEHATRGWGELLAATMTGGGPVAARLAEYFRAVACDVERDAALWRAIAVSGAYNPVRDPAVLGDAGAGTRVLERVLADGQARGELTRAASPELMASVLEGAMLRAVIEWGAAYPDRTPLADRMGACFDFFMRAAARREEEPC